MQVFPYEILVKILGQVDNVYACSQVCKQWYLPCMFILYRSISLDKIEHQMRFLNCLRLYSDVPVDSVSLGMKYRKALSETEFIELLNYMPSLRQLVLDPSSPYWKYLPSVSLPQLESLTATRKNKQLSQPLVFTHYRSTLTHLEVYSVDALYPHYSTLSDYLSQFTQLRHLSILAGTEVVPLDPILEVCSLQTLQCKVPCFVIPSTAPYLSLLKLKLNVSTVDSTLLEYIMHRFKHLQELRLDIKGSEWMPEHDSLFINEWIPFVRRLDYGHMTMNVRGSSSFMNLIQRHWLQASTVNRVLFEVKHGPEESCRLYVSTTPQKGAGSLVFFANDSQLPYLDWLSHCGQLIDQTRIYHGKDIHSPIDLDKIMNLCPRLFELSLAYSRVSGSIQLSPTGPEYPQVTSISFNCVNLSSVFLESLATRFPKLSGIYISHGLLDHKENVYSLVMAQARLQKLTLNLYYLLSQYPTLFIHVQTDTKSMIYRFKADELDVVESVPEGKSHAVVFIRMSQIESLCIQWDYYNMDKNHLLCIS